MERPFKDLELENALGFFRVIDEEGNVVNDAFIEDVSDSILIDMYTYMIRARILDQWLLKLQRMGRVALHAPNKGQEAVAVGATMALRKEDWLFPSYRELGAYLVRGMSEEEILDRALANIDDPLKGSDFAIYGHRKYNMVPAPVPVANQIPHAVGAAIAAKILGDPIVTMTFFGDGATSRGDFHAGLNFAGVFKAPVVFVLQNNQWAISVPVKRQTAAKTLAIKAIGYGIRGVRIDGNDILAVYTTAKAAVEAARRGEGPTLIEALTYRLGPHTTADDPKRYRSDEEVSVWERREPIRRFRLYLLKSGVIDEKMDSELWRRHEERIEKAVIKSLEKPPLPPEAILEDVYSEMPWNLREQLAELRESLRVMKELGVRVE
ncbi:MAG: pyruvate dehydrogenase (acetyl-transferring) E1 component subunit alpha [Desulfurococcales archaeon]|nr:pyruvate dehydrogenase (acetyl-transferring) E1 component subunit alpha [Desulfurococcales archaeon]